MLFLAFACGQSGTEDRSTIYVSITPLKGLVTSIVEDDFEVQVLVPSGASPETFEPSARQLAALHEAQWVFQVGLIDFETTLLDKLQPADHVVSLHDGVELIAGSCSHGEPLKMPDDCPALRLVQRLRDEAHRFANSYNADLRSKKIRESVLDEM
ncbi:MAG: zinc ABC transporter substrate-binding protein, partial [Alistipes sp.]|nr:zinc ABC transporter substrate-binding protein [Alistipes sp.]